MKKIIMFAAVLATVAMSQAASLDWQYTAGQTDVGQKVYLCLGATAMTEWESLAALEAKALDSAEVAKSGRTYFAKGSTTSDLITKDSASVYFVVVSAAKDTFSVTSVQDMTASVFDTTAQESSPGANDKLTSASITKSGIAWGTGTTDPVVPTPTPDVPEPTSGLLLVLGGAALALRRKQK